MFFVEAIVALVLAPILPHIVSIAVHHSILEGTLKVAAIGPLEAALTAHLISEPRARVFTAVGPKVASFAFLDTAEKVSMVVATITPHLNALSILLVLLAARDIRLRVHVV